MVTGGTGFLGSHIARECLARGAKVRVISTGRNKRNIGDLLKKPNFSLFAGDITDFDFLVESLKGIDLVMHFASFTETGKTYRGPLMDFKVNVTGTLLLLEAMRKNNVSKIIFASTGKVYGRPKYAPQDESHPVEPLDPYSTGKYVCEKYICLYGKLFGIDYLNLRIFGIYGPGQTPKPGSLVGVISIFVENILKGNGITIYGDGTLKRDFLYVEDFTRIVLKLLEKGLWQNTFNIASGKIVTLNELADILRKNLKSYKFKINFKGPLESDADLEPDTSLLKAKINFEPKVSLPQGIQRYIDWYTQREGHGLKAV